MKTTILSIATVLLIIFSISTSGFAASKATGAQTVLNDVANISQIEVHGNVELFVSTGETENVKVYDSYYSQNALVQEQDGVLRISSFKAEKLVVWVTVNQLQSISAYDNAEVKSFGKLSTIDFSLNLNNNATAKLDLDVSDATIALNGNAKASLSGYADESYIELSQAAKVNTAKFAATVHVKKHTPIVMAAQVDADELIGVN